LSPPSLPWSGIHTAGFHVTRTGGGPLQTTVNAPGSIRTQRVATATGQVILDNDVLVDGTADHPDPGPAPFIRTDIEK
jgi:hypothetical protein